MKRAVHVTLALLLCGPRPEPDGDAASHDAGFAGLIVLGLAHVTTPVAGLVDQTRGLLAVLALWSFAAAWPIGVLDPQALETAGREVGFPVGHASAAVSFDGLRARPIWNVLLFSADEPPTRRGLVRVDAVDGHVVGKWEEEIAPSPQPPVPSP